MPDPLAVTELYDKKLDIDNLPDGVISGSTLIGFEAGLSRELRASVALCLTAAQKVASADSVAISPDLWVERHHMVLSGLNWVSTDGREVFTERTAKNVAVHKAIIPFLTAAFGPAVTATSLIVKAIEQIRKMQEDVPWITLFERESRRYDVSEFRFATAAEQNGTVVLRFAAARFSARQERLQILFFKKNDIDVSFRLASRTMTANADLLESMNSALAAKLQGHTDRYIAALDF
ncbi:hypothetical protein [Altererythrobacter sp.]|uniref:hypothetical protein n=1 Tax=Altererythrobacter sp. TaxID=1872480 RepID=UPI003D05B319